MPDELDGAMRMRSGFGMEGQDIGPRLGEFRDVLIDRRDHQMAVEGLVAVRAKRLHHHRADGDVGHEMPVHDIDVDVIRAGSIDRLHLRAQPGEIGRQNRGRDAGRLLHPGRITSAALRCHETICPGWKAMIGAPFRAVSFPVPARVDVPGRRAPVRHSSRACGKIIGPRRRKPDQWPEPQDLRMTAAFLDHVSKTLDGIRADGFWKAERKIATPQDSHIRLEDGRNVLNFCANNYLGLADDKRLLAGAKDGLDRYGFGMASVRFICGTQILHKELEAELARFLGVEDSILYSSCFDANGGLFETLLGEEDAIVSDALNHASIIDGVRLCKAKRYRYANNDMADLETQLQAADAAGARFKMIATDGVFSMDGVIADLKAVIDLAAKYKALVMVDDSHAVGFVGPNGRGAPELRGVGDRVDLYTGTLGKALGGASGGYIAGKKPVIDLLRQRSRPYLFSNSLAPSIVSASLTVLKLLQTAEGADLRARLQANSERFRGAMAKLGFKLAGAGHPIIPVMLGEAKLATAMADALLQEGIYVIGFSFPVVPKGQARIRTQMSAAHSSEDIDRAVAAFERVGRAMGAIQ
jgi:glycine C-acetyltransferase